MGSDQFEYGERLAKLETKLEIVADAIIRLETKLDAYSTNFVPRAEINEMFRSRDARIRALEDDQKTRRTNWPAWVAAIGAAGAFLATWIHK